MAPTAWEFRNKLTAMLNAAKHSGKPYVDVESDNLLTELLGNRNSDHGTPICRDVMTKLMRPGDSILKDTGNEHGATLMIRYLLKAKHEN